MDYYTEVSVTCVVLIDSHFVLIISGQAIGYVPIVL